MDIYNLVGEPTKHFELRTLKQGFQLDVNTIKRLEKAKNKLQRTKSFIVRKAINYFLDTIEELKG